MKKKIIILFFISCLFGINSADVLGASGINSAEQSILNIVQGGFSYNGNYYTVPSQYINQAINYLNQDGVDLTSEQASVIEQRIYQLIPTGIERGYLQASGTINTDDSISKDDNVNTDNNTNTDNDTNTDNNINIDNNNQTSNTESSTKTAPIEITDDMKIDVGDGITGLIDSAKDITSEMGLSVSYDLANNSIDVTNEEGNTILKSSSTIKQTGYTINFTVYCFGVLLIILVTCIMLVFKYKLYNDCEESYES